VCSERRCQVLKLSVEAAGFMALFLRYRGPNPSHPPARFPMNRSPASSMKLGAMNNSQKRNLVDVGGSGKSLVSGGHHLFRDSAFGPLGCPPVDRAGIFTIAFREQFLQLRLK
jgi:hypothetical protein